jgi:hypothetical protein
MAIEIRETSGAEKEVESSRVPNGPYVSTVAVLGTLTGVKNN